MTDAKTDAVGGYNYALEQVRQALQVYFMGGDVGVDNERIWQPSR